MPLLPAQPRVATGDDGLVYPPCTACGRAMEAVFKREEATRAFIRVPGLFYCAQDDRFVHERDGKPVNA